MLLKFNNNQQVTYRLINNNNFFFSESQTCPKCGANNNYSSRET